MPRGLSVYESAKMQGRLWNPAILRPLFWFDVSDISTLALDSSNKVSQIRDKSGFNRHISQGNSSLLPTYIPVDKSIRAQSDQRLALSSQIAFNGDFSFILVVAALGDIIAAFDSTYSLDFASYGTAWLWAKDSTWGQLGSSGRAATRFESPSFVTINNIMLTTPTLTSFRRTGTNLVFQIGKTVVQKTANSVVAYIDFPIGQIQNNIPVDNRYYEVIAFDRALSDPELQALQGYLSAKYKLEIEPTHPYINNPPLIGC